MPQTMKQHRSQGGQSQGGEHETVLFTVGGASATAPQRPVRVLWAAPRRSPVQTVLTSQLAALGGELRQVLEALTASGALAALRQVVEGRTWLASLVRTPELAPESVARRPAHRVFTLHRSRMLDVVVERWGERPHDFVRVPETPSSGHPRARKVLLPPEGAPRSET